MNLVLSEVDGPLPGFPINYGNCYGFCWYCVINSIFKDTKAAEYNGPELLVVAGGIGIFVSTFIIGWYQLYFLYNSLA